MTDNKYKQSWIIFAIIFVFILFSINPVLGAIALVIFVKAIQKNPDLLKNFSTGLLKDTLLQVVKEAKKSGNKTENKEETDIIDISAGEQQAPTATINAYLQNKTAIISNLLQLQTKAPRKLERKKKYLQIALNSNLEDAAKIIRLLPSSEKIIIEAGTPLIKTAGVRAVSAIKRLSGGAYVVADNKIADMAQREVRLMADAGANAATCLGVAPIETIDEFIAACADNGLDSMLDMMNVESPLIILKKIKTLPNVVILHRGVDETELSMEKHLPFYQINQIKGAFNIMVAVAGGDTPREIQGAVFNGADIVVVWKNFYQADENIGQLARDFLKEIK